jgi:hypothetical protein
MDRCKRELNLAIQQAVPLAAVGPFESARHVVTIAGIPAAAKKESLLLPLHQFTVASGAPAAGGAQIFEKLQSIDQPKPSSSPRFAVGSIRTKIRDFNQYNSSQ